MGKTICPVRLARGTYTTIMRDGEAECAGGADLPYFRAEAEGLYSVLLQAQDNFIPAQGIAAHAKMPLIKVGDEFQQAGHVDVPAAFAGLAHADNPAFAMGPI